ncbi:MAG: YitT family protein [Erysipelotrichia bacterium]|nr:YitT family protein [Erysipelotrichia bacterium]
MKNTIKEYLSIIFFSFIFAISCNLFIVPYGLYNGGIIGLAQLVRTLIVDNFNLDINFDLTGLTNLLINIPLLILAIKKLNKNFVYKTIVSVIVQTVAFSILFESSPISDKLVSIIVGGAISGFAVARILVAKASGGGNDIIGMLLTLRYPFLSVGKYCLYFNCVLYLLCGILFNFEVAIYSIIQAFVYSFMVDKGHLENIDVVLMIFTKNKDIKKMIMDDNHRGVTTWMGKGAYTDLDTEVLVSVVSKYEVPLLKKKIRMMDKDAFVIVTNVEDVSGGYEKRLV